MPGKAIGIELNLGYPGTVARSVDTIITPKTVSKEETELIKFGDLVVLNKDNTYSKFKTDNIANDFVGIAIREVKQAIDYYSGSGSYLPGETCDAINRGTITVFCNNGTPIAGGKVFVRIKENEEIPDGKIGQLEAIADGDNTIEIPNLKWTTGKIDSNNVAEVTILNRTI
ncbi:hypothetical protein DP145_01720 [Clostridium tetani]|uniref:structural cement protein Gp24 n=1 Tax=Clostridium tetani TaxID=1513 RepID=UPI00100C080A|nr:hypothetical protein [Clostridium tetani]RXI46082.1 hypothetical protein DP126_07800 [Clostridium tetani]RXM61474.1 hypothetical protein DP138_04635 [Clostridium tetani]RXM70299.1 hypothetical protein DP145_01720 [Clostridium tetani]